jgi:putative membrane protein
MLCVALACVPGMSAAQTFGSGVIGATNDPGFKFGKHGQDESFVSGILSDGNAAVLLSKLAMEKASSTEVKALATKILAVQAGVGKQFADDSAMTGAKVPAGLNKKYKKVEEKLNGLSGEAFDREYLAQMVQLHHDTIDQLRGELNASANTMLRDDASNALRDNEALAGEIKALAEKMGAQ